MLRAVALYEASLGESTGTGAESTGGESTGSGDDGSGNAEGGSVAPGDANQVDPTSNTVEEP